MFCKGLRNHSVPVRKPNDLYRFVFEVKLNLTPFAVAVCLIQVGRGGDFFIPPLLRIGLHISRSPTTSTTIITGLLTSISKKQACSETRHPFTVVTVDFYLPGGIFERSRDWSGFLVF